MQLNPGVKDAMYPLCVQLSVPVVKKLQAPSYPATGGSARFPDAKSSWHVQMPVARSQVPWPEQSRGHRREPQLAPS